MRSADFTTSGRSAGCPVRHVAEGVERRLGAARRRPGTCRVRSAPAGSPSPGAACPRDQALGEALMVEVRDLLAQLVVLEQCRAARAPPWASGPCPAGVAPGRSSDTHPSVPGPRGRRPPGRRSASAPPERPGTAGAPMRQGNGGGAAPERAVEAPLAQRTSCSRRLVRRTPGIRRRNPWRRTSSTGAEALVGPAVPSPARDGGGAWAVERPARDRRCPAHSPERGRLGRAMAHPDGAGLRRGDRSARPGRERADLASRHGDPPDISAACLHAVAEADRG